MIVGLISDTHGLLRPEVARVLAGVDRILHAGDVGNRTVLEGLANIAPVDAVYGNVDDRNDPALARERTLTHDGVTIHVSHGHELGRPTAELALARYLADIVVFGHTHRAVTVRTADGRLAINPGAAGPRRFDVTPTVGRLVFNGASDHLHRLARIEVEIISLA